MAAIKATDRRQTRSPLSDRTNSPRNSRSPSPVFHSAKSGDSRQSCLRKSARQPYRDADSSEECPSDHSSICLASRYPSAELLAAAGDLDSSKESIISVIRFQEAGVTSTESSIRYNEAIAEGHDGSQGIQAASGIEIPRKGHPRGSLSQGTPLDTITEQNSMASLRPMIIANRPCPTRSLEQSLTPAMPATITETALRETTEINSQTTVSIPVELISHAPCPVDKRTMGQDDPSQHPIDRLPLVLKKPRCRALAAFAAPAFPPFAPPIRRTTPDGLPSWTAAQLTRHRPIRLQTAPQPVGFRSITRRLFARRSVSPPSAGSSPRSGTSTIKIKLSKIDSNDRGRPRDRLHDVSHGAVQPGRWPRAPRFRPLSSGFRSYGTIEDHPFHYAPVARMPSQAQIDASVCESPEHGWHESPTTMTSTLGLNSSERPRRVHFSSSITGGSELLDEPRMSGGVSLLTSPENRPSSTRQWIGPSFCEHVQHRRQTVDFWGQPMMNAWWPRQQVVAIADERAETGEGCWRCRMKHWYVLLGSICCGVVDMEEGELLNAREVNHSHQW